MAFIRVLKFTGFTVLLSLFLVGPLFAQLAVVDIEPDEQTSPFRFSAGYGHLFKTDITSGGNFERDGFRLLFNGDFNITSDLKLNNFVSYDFHHYDFSSSSRFQWNDIHFANYVPLLSWKFDQKWTLLAAPLVRLNMAGDAKLKDSVRGGGFVGFNYISSPDLSLGLLAGVMDQIEDDAQFIAFPIINWKFADAWKVQTGVFNLGSQNGVGAEIGWHVTSKVELVGGAQFQRRRFRLNGNSQVGQDTRIPIYGKLSFAMSSQANLDIFAGLAAGGELRLESKSGKKLQEKSYDTTPMLGLKFKYAFES